MEKDTQFLRPQIRLPTNPKRKARMGRQALRISCGTILLAPAGRGFGPLVPLQNCCLSVIHGFSRMQSAVGGDSLEGSTGKPPTRRINYSKEQKTHNAQI